MPPWAWLDGITFSNFDAYMPMRKLNCCQHQHVWIVMASCFFVVFFCSSHNCFGTLYKLFISAKYNRITAANGPHHLAKFLWWLVPKMQVHCQKQWFPLCSPSRNFSSHVEFRRSPPSTFWPPTKKQKKTLSDTSKFRGKKWKVGTTKWLKAQSR